MNPQYEPVEFQKLIKHRIGVRRVLECVFVFCLPVRMIGSFLSVNSTRTANRVINVCYWSKKPWLNVSPHAAWVKCISLCNLNESVTQNHKTTKQPQIPGLHLNSVLVVFPMLCVFSFSCRWDQRHFHGGAGMLALFRNARCMQVDGTFPQNLRDENLTPQGFT